MQKGGPKGRPLIFELFASGAYCAAFDIRLRSCGSR